jgi:hypothetical protein
MYVVASCFIKVDIIRGGDISEFRRQLSYDGGGSAYRTAGGPLRY